MPKTHYAFTVGKDGLLKYWDADRFELLLTLEGHKAEVYISLGTPAYCFSFQFFSTSHSLSWGPRKITPAQMKKHRGRKQL